MIENQILKLFPEPIFKYKFKDYENLNKELSDYIYSLQNKDKEGLKDQTKVVGIQKFSVN